MEHHVARAVPGRLLFTTWEEGLELWGRLITAVPALIALFLMPDHLHLLARPGQRARVGRGLQGYARWFNGRHGATGAVFLRSPPPTIPKGQQKQRRDERYIHLQACRAGLADDPLAWPLSTHRDAVGLVLDPVRHVVPDPWRYHQWVSADGTVDVGGTELPLGAGRTLRGVDDIVAVGVAVSAVSRTPWHRMHQRGPARSLWVRASLALVEADLTEVASVIGVSERSCRRALDLPVDRQVRLVERVVGDRRFPELDDGDLRRRPEWQRYARWRR